VMRTALMGRASVPAPDPVIDVMTSVLT
jgi:hypothetical protein